MTTVKKPSSVGASIRKHAVVMLCFFHCVLIAFSSDGAEKQKAFVHIGGPKTASTAVQKFLMHNVDDLWEDGYNIALRFDRRHHNSTNHTDHLYPLIKRLPFCLWNQSVPLAHDRCGNQSEHFHLIWEYFNSTAEAGHDIILSEEWLQRETIADGLAGFLDESWDTTIVIYYRRFYDFARSLFHFRRTKERSLEQSFLSFLRSKIFKKMNKDAIKEIGGAVQRMEEYNVTLARTLLHSNQFHSYTWNGIGRYRAVPRFADSIRVVNFHDGDPVQNFVCDELSHAPQACHQAKLQVGHKRNAATPSGHGVVYQLEDIAIEAFKRQLHTGIFAKRKAIKGNASAKKVDREQLMEWVEIMTERLTNSGKTVQDLPVECLNDFEFYSLLALSLEYEKLIVPSFYESPSGSASLRRQLLDERGDFCSVNAEKVLSDDEWRFLYADMETSA